MPRLDPDSAQTNALSLAEHAFHSDVLQLGEEAQEEQLDKQIQMEAKELGIDAETLPSVPLAPSKRPLAQPFVLEHIRRSDSIDSRTSQSTGITSDYSEVARDGGGHDRRPSRTSLSFRDYDSFLSKGRTNGRHSISFSPTMPSSQSSFSLPLTSPSSPPKRTFRHLRGLSMLIRRSDSTSSSVGLCPHCPRDTFSHNRARHPLACGHRLCTQALRQTVHSAIASGSAGVPSCCGIPIPGRLVECVITKEEHSAILTRLEHWDEAASIAPSVESERRSLPPSNRPSADRRTISSDSKVDSVSPHHGQVPTAYDFSQSPAIRGLQKQYDELNERFAAWKTMQEDGLRALHASLRKAMASRHESAVDELIEYHVTAMADAEDKQVKAEADMREFHAREERDNATALKHMEAFCSGVYGSGEAHDRVVTGQDHAEVEKTKALRAAMPARHENAINVLRGEQSKRMQMRAQKQEREEQDFRRALRMEELELERACTAEMQALQGLVANKRKMVNRRHELQRTILVAKGSGLESRTRQEVPTEDQGRGNGQEDYDTISTAATTPAIQLCIQSPGVD